MCFLFRNQIFEVVKAITKFQLHRFLNTFSQLPAVKKYSKNGAAGKILGPSYFDPALVTFSIFFTSTFTKPCKQCRLYMVSIQKNV